MLIACLGWGSLVWDPRQLPVRRPWFTDGPFLPIEFARQSRDDRITLVLVDGVPLVRTLWALLSVANLDEAGESLASREDVPAEKFERHIAHWRVGVEGTHLHQRIGQWATKLGLDAVVWTNLPPKFRGENGRIPSGEELVDHLRALRGKKRENAKRYIRMAPRQIDTEYRRLVEARLRWTPIGPL